MTIKQAALRATTFALAASGDLIAKLYQERHDACSTTSTARST